MTSTTAFEAEILPLQDCKDWQHLVETSATSTVFHEHWYLRHLGIRRLAIVCHKGEVVGAMPVFDGHGVRETAQNGLLVPYCGPIIPTRHQDLRRQMTFARDVCFTLIALLQDRFDLVRFALAPTHLDVVPFIEKGFFPELRFTYRRGRPIAPDKLSNGRRSDLERFRKQGGTITPDQALERFDVEAACRWNPDASYIAKSRRILEDACMRDRARVYVGDFAGQHLGGLLVMTDGVDAFCTHSYYTDKGAKLGASTALYLHALDSHFADPRAECFDFEGSVLTGVERFYQSFAARQTPYIGLHWAADPARLKLASLYTYK